MSGRHVSVCPHSRPTRSAHQRSEIRPSCPNVHDAECRRRLTLHHSHKRPIADLDPWRSERRVRALFIDCCPATFCKCRKNCPTWTAHSGPLSGPQRTAAPSPICEFGILAARARSEENATIAKSSLPPRGGKTGHSCKAQQDKSVEVTDCGQICRCTCGYC